MISSYSDLLARVESIVTGDELATGTVVSTLSAMVNAAERRIYREVRSRYNEKAFSGVTASGNLAALPDDFEEVSVIHFGGKALEPVAEEWLMAYLDAGAAGDCTYFAQAGDSLTFGPAVADGTSVQGRYFCRLPDLTTANFTANALVAREPDLFVYAACVECAPELSGAASLQLWEAKYQAIRDRINTSTARTAHNAGRIRVRPSTNLMR